jgi:putative transcriptional regulator
MFCLTEENGEKMNRTEMMCATESVLKTAGFQVSEKCSARPSCFCLAIRKGAQLTFLRVQPDLGNISQRDASELKTIASYFLGTTLFVSNKAREKPLEDDTVYSRYSIYAVTPKTLEDVISRRLLPLIEAGPGGCFVRLDAEAVRKRRQELGLSIGKVAEQLGVSRRTLYGYEKGMAKASVAAAYNLEWILGIPMVRSVDVFQHVMPDTGFFAAAKRAIVRNRFLKIVLKRLAQCHFKVAPTTRAPFDFIAQNAASQLSIIGGVAQDRERDLNQRAKEILSISEIVKAQPIFVTDGKLVPNNDIPLIHSRELEDLRQPEDLIAKL